MGHVETDKAVCGGHGMSKREREGLGYGVCLSLNPNNTRARLLNFLGDEHLKPFPKARRFRFLGMQTFWVPNLSQIFSSVQWYILVLHCDAYRIMTETKAGRGSVRGIIVLSLKLNPKRKREKNEQVGLRRQLN